LDRHHHIEARCRQILAEDIAKVKTIPPTAEPQSIFSEVLTKNCGKKNSAISKEEKHNIRARLLSSSIDEAQPQLAVQNAVIVGKVVRLEYPLEWPKVFTDITAIVRQASDATSNGRTDEQASLRLTRSLSILLHVVKELATGRLSRTKSSLQSVTPEILKVLGDVYIRHVQVWQNLLGQPSAPAERTQQMMTISLSALKIMRRLIVAGYEFPNRATEVNQAWTLLREHVWVFFNADSEVAAASVEINGLLRKHVVNIGKVFLDVIAHHQAAFALLPGTLELLGRYWEVVVAHGETLAAQSKSTAHDINGASTGSNDVAEDEAERVRQKFREKVALQGMLLFRGAVKMIHSPIATFKCRSKASGTGGPKTDFRGQKTVSRSRRRKSRLQPCCSRNSSFRPRSSRIVWKFWLQNTSP